MIYLLHCIMRRERGGPRRSARRIGGRAVSLISAGGLSAAISPRARADRSPAPAELLAHARVVEFFNCTRTVIPMRYGCWVASAALLKRMLAQRRMEYCAMLEQLEGCVEMGIRVLIPPPHGARPGVLLPRAVPRAGARCLPGAAYLAARRSYYGAKDRLESDRARIAGEVRAQLHRLFVRCVMEPSRQGPPALLSLHFLVRKKGLTRLRGAFGRIRLQEPAELLLSGPWPPYNFVSGVATAASKFGLPGGENRAA